MKKSWQRKTTEWMFDHPLTTTIIISIPTLILITVFLAKNHII